jgi:hypothetical protein
MDAPDHAGATRSHMLLRFDESAVRAEIAGVIATDETLTSLTADDVTDADIAACCAVEQADLSEERSAAVFRAVLKAIREAERRLAAST